MLPNMHGFVNEALVEGISSSSSSCYTRLFIMLCLAVCHFSATKYLYIYF